MQIPVLLEPVTKGFRASIQSPIPISAEARTEDEAIAAFHVAFQGRLHGGGKIRFITLSDPESAVLFAEKMRTNPVHSEMLKSIEEYRKSANAVEDAG
jgi:hypothetical protein